ncbi:putative regulator of septum formation [Kribbella orskensis]|uniref:Regulator of septum formation n=1 Tax=Kribbella orskensis TaxID=2512216 RepID=A0ABY2BLQ1_9ACTN|nr:MULTISPECIES: DUF4190 domain-containing protein [Kribbella]TCN39110.1 putative regulator of septum formation [Kribbella sp. VKM Ac-2500]TCO21757.1 putative regulator of septum formation [Kribbella orskensis]
MSQPPSGPDQYRPGQNRPDPNRPQDIRPQDTPRDFPTYGRPQPPAQPSYPQPTPYQQYQQPQQPSAYQQPQQQSPYQPQGSPYQPAPQGSPYGQQPSPNWQPYPQQPVYPPAYGYGYGYPGALQDKTNALAIAALVTGLAGLFFGITAPIAIGLGIAALVQIKKRRESGTGQAVAGLVIGSLVTTGWAILLVIMFAIDWTGSGEEYYGAPPPTSSVPATYVDELAVGECFDEVGSDDEVEREVCLEPHDAEMFAVETLPPRPWPGESAVVKASEAACDKAFLSYVGIEIGKSRLDTDFWYPDSASWDEGDRKVLCIAYGPDGDQLDGSVRGTKR